MEMNHMMNTARKLDTVFRVLQWLMIAAIVVAILSVSVLTFVTIRHPDALLTEPTISLKLGPVEMELMSEYSAGSQSILFYSWILLLVVCSSVMVAGYLAFRYIRNILVPIKQGNPFHMDASRNLKKLAWVVLGLGIVRNVVNFVGASAVLGLVDFTACEGIRSASIHMDLELGFLLVFFGLLLLSYIFHYGAALQQLSDETL